jgi:hypothetical protein
MEQLLTLNAINLTSDGFNDGTTDTTVFPSVTDGSTGCTGSGSNTCGLGGTMAASTTELIRRLARELRLTLIGFLRGRRFIVNMAAYPRPLLKSRRKISAKFIYQFKNQNPFLRNSSPALQIDTSTPPGKMIITVLALWPS